MTGPKQIVTKVINTAGTLVLSPPVGGFGYFINHGPRDKKKIALTFDDGPSQPCTEALIDAMGEIDVKGTFFCVGVNVRWHQDLLYRMHNEGHIIGNHSLEHSRKSGLKFGADDGHIAGGEKAISEVIGLRPQLYRPPWGWMTPWEGKRLTEAGYKIIGWDVYTLDWKWPEPDGQAVAKDAVQKTQPGSILLFHDANAGVKVWDKKETIRAIQHIVPLLRAQGYEFVTIPELLGIPAYQSLPQIPSSDREIQH
jgi:peptidoglycan/xylan/chitin deacetylase (PgdA/CDA1 family)